MRRFVNLHAAKTHLSRLVDAASSGEEIVIAKAGRPVARLVPLAKASIRRKPGLLRGRVRVGRDFDEPLSPDLLALFEGG